MKKNMKNGMIVLALFTASFAQAQTKVAHINTGEILQKMPEIKDIEKQLGEYQASF